MRVLIRAVAVALLTDLSSVAEAQFPPQFMTPTNGSTTSTIVDPNNPSSLTRTTISPGGLYKIIDHYYYDCLKRKWVWVSREWSAKSPHAFSSDEFSPIAPPQGQPASPSVTQLPSGPPPGAETSPSDLDRAFNPTTGQNFAKEPDGSWIDVKTGKTAVAPKLCPCPEPQTTTPPPRPAPQQPKLDKTSSRILEIHNQERFAVQVPPLRWNFQLQQDATGWAQQLSQTGQLIHAPREGRGIERENLGRGRIGWSADQIIRSEWVNEKPHFHAGVFPSICAGDWSQCAHYSQIIWPTTTDIGCGMATGSGFEWLVCRYSPGGNKPGKTVGMPYMPERG